jgi:hypothetical protein
MVSCALVQRELPQYVADGEPALPLYASLRAHIAGCPACSAYAARLRLVEEALHTYPTVPAAAGLGEKVLAMVDLESQRHEDEWHLWQWDLWIPAFAFVAAVLIAILSLPPGFVSWGSLAEWANTPVVGPQALPAWLETIKLNASSSVFWAVWVGVFVTTAGLGISLSLAYWDHRHSQRINDIESQVSELATRAWTEARRTR